MAMSGVLKRKFEDVDEETYYSSSPASSPSSPALSHWDSDQESHHSDSLDFRPANPDSLSEHTPISSTLKKTRVSRPKGSVRFDAVTVFLFLRCQGFTSVPGRGGCTLGMAPRHSAWRRFTMAEHAAEQHLLRREKLREQLGEERLEALKQRLTCSATLATEEVAAPLAAGDVPDEDMDLCGADLEDGGAFLHPYPSKKRRALLRAAGVVIDREEKRQLQELRRAREDCGCHCQGFCEPDTCACSLAGIKCQMDRSNFPCGCTTEGCGNITGRTEFNSSRVQSHYIHTHMRLELERRLLDEQGSPESSGHSGSPTDEGSDQRHAPRGHEQGSPESSGPSGSPADEGYVAPGSPSLPPSPAFRFSAGPAAGENSCSSDTTDSSCSSGQSLYSDAGVSPPRGHPLLDVDDRGLARILSFCDSDGEDFLRGDESDSSSDQELPNQQHSTGDFTQDNSSSPVWSNAAYTHSGNNCSSSCVEYLDENANQATTLYLCDPFLDIPNTPSPSTDHTSSSYMDLSLSSDSDLDFFDSLDDYSLSLIHSHLKYDNVDNIFPLQFPNCPNQGDEPGINMLEALIGLQPEGFPDNHLLEEVVR